MSSFRLSKSTYCQGVQCPKMLWLDKYKPEEAKEADNEAILETGTAVGEIAKGLFGPYHNINRNQGVAQMLNDTEDAITSGQQIITEASFAEKNNFCSIDILKNDQGVFDIYEVKSSTEIKDIYLDDLAYQYYVLTSLGMEIRSANVVYLNNEYVRYGELDLAELFIIANKTREIVELRSNVELRIKAINEYMAHKEEQPKDIGLYCSEPYDCLYWQYCSRHLPANNVFEIAEMRKKKKFELYYEGIYTFEDLKFCDLNPKYLEQINFEIDNLKPKIEKEEIECFLKGLTFPLFFLDFESYQQAIPLYDGISPYMQIPFQYSLHYLEKEGGELKHLEYLAKEGEDPRAALAKALVRDIPADACVLAYNMMFEKGIIKNLAKMYPEIATHLLCIYENIQDLMIPFRERLFYAKEMKGSYSIKKVLPTLFPNDNELNYAKLGLIHNGSEAMNAFASLHEKKPDEIMAIRKALLTYCKLDTLAMVKIWQKLRELSK